MGPILDYQSTEWFPKFTSYGVGCMMPRNSVAKDREGRKMGKRFFPQRKPLRELGVKDSKSNTRASLLSRLEISSSIS